MLHPQFWTIDILEIIILASEFHFFGRPFDGSLPQFDRLLRRHGKQFRLGDNVRVRVAKINAFRSEIDFELVVSAGGSEGQQERKW